MTISLRIHFPVGALFPARTGGNDQTLYWLAKHLKAKGFQTVLIATDEGLEKNEVPRNRWLETDAGKVMYVRQLFHFFPVFFVLKNLVQCLFTDIVHLSSVFYPPSLLIGHFARLLRKTVVWSVHGELYDNAIKFNKIRKLLYLNLVPRQYVTFHGTSRDEIKCIEKYLKPKNIVFIPHFIELQSSRKIHRKNIVGFLGRVHPIKGLKNLILSLSQTTLFQKRNYILQIAGKIEDENYFEELKGIIAAKNLNQYVQFLQELTGDSKFNFLASLKVLVLPSFSENFGLVVTEALNQKTPVVASKGTPWKILEEYAAGRWLDNSPTSLAEGIDGIIELNSVEYECMQENCLKLLHNEFKIENKINIWTNLYSKLMVKST